jgi:hypothetical protein
LPSGRSWKTPVRESKSPSLKSTWWFQPRLSSETFGRARPRGRHETKDKHKHKHKHKNQNKDKDKDRGSKKQKKRKQRRATAHNAVVSQ